MSEYTERIAKEYKREQPSPKGLDGATCSAILVQRASAGGMTGGRRGGSRIPELPAQNVSEIKRKQVQLRRMKSDAKTAMLCGRHGWGDHYRRESIKTLRREIQILQQNDQGQAIRAGSAAPPTLKPQ